MHQLRSYLPNFVDTDISTTRHASAPNFVHIPFNPPASYSPAPAIATAPVRAGAGMAAAPPRTQAQASGYAVEAQAAMMQQPQFPPVPNLPPARDAVLLVHVQPPHHIHPEVCRLIRRLSRQHSALAGFAADCNTVYEHNAISKRDHAATAYTQPQPQPQQVQEHSARYSDPNRQPAVHRSRWG